MTPTGYFLEHLWLIPLFPLVTAALMLFLGRRLPNAAVSFFCVGSVGLSFLCALGAVTQLLSADPSYYDAYLASGVENYLLGISPAPVRWFLRIGGAHTDKTRGIQELQLTASHGHYLAPYARLLLAVAALRDKDRATARTLLEGLAREFPQNPLYARELSRIQP